MIDRPFDQIRRLFRENNQKSKELLTYVFEKSDALSLWIIGLSIGGISLIVANIVNLKKTLIASDLNNIVLFLSISVISGIVYRTLFLYWFVIQNHIGFEIDVAFTVERKMHVKSVLTGNESYNELLLAVEDGSGIDYSNFIPTYENADEIKKQILYDSMVKHYLANIDFAIKDYEIAMDFVADTYSKAAAISKEEFWRRAISTNSGLKAKRLSYFIRGSYLIFMLSFIIALAYFIFSVK